MSRRLIIDAQLFQTPAWHRGMGKYSLELIASLLAAGNKKGWDSIEILLSSNASQNAEMIETIQKKLHGARVTNLDLLPNEIGNASLPELNRKKIDDYVSQTYQEDVATDFLILSLMQGEIASVFPSDPRVRKLLLFYDLIPLMFHDAYLKNPITRVEYLSKLAELFKADVYFAISKTVANDLSIYLGVDATRIFSIDGGPINHSQEPKAYNITDPFILMPTGNDLRKNNQRAIVAFDKFNKEHDNRYTLVITSFFKTSQVVELSKLSSNVHFTGNVSGEQLNYLYAKCDLVLFPPEYEGLGLPILEAMEQSKPIACSDISVFREMSTDAFCYFNPASIESIKNALEKIVQKPTVDKRKYAKILDEYIWHKTANKMIAALEETKTRSVVEECPKVAIFGPDPCNTWLGKSMQMMHAELCSHLLIDYFVSPSENSLETRINYLPYVSEFTNAAGGMGFRPSEYDEVIYHIANDESAATTLFSALAVPGIVILHDIDLRRTWRAGVAGGLIDQTRLDLEMEIDKEYSVTGSHLITSLLSRQKAVIVFSDQAKKIVETTCSHIEKNVEIIRTKLPVSGLVYDSTLPEKNIPKTSLEELNVLVRNPRRTTDFRINEQLARTQSIVVSGDNQQLMYEAMSFGVIPEIEDSRRYLLDDTLTLKSGSEPHTLTEAILLNVRNEHQETEFCATLAGLVRRLNEQKVQNV
jgi:glycosyltransferase involved in cell wall biosynthesis